MLRQYQKQVLMVLTVNPLFHWNILVEAVPGTEFLLLFIKDLSFNSV